MMMMMMAWASLRSHASTRAATDAVAGVIHGGGQTEAEALGLVAEFAAEAVYNSPGSAAGSRVKSPARSTQTVKSLAGKPKSERGHITSIEDVFSDAENRRNTEVARK
jgi:hypothetical protein